MELRLLPLKAALTSRLMASLWGFALAIGCSKLREALGRSAISKLMIGWAKLKHAKLK